ncbi:MAG: hypothetical protein U9O96_02645 [Candidatus Thermoplasmatota archaeon]|nr:hypothetical protein [Candidatus Thermoplasmatota archaeon]
MSLKFIPSIISILLEVKELNNESKRFLVRLSPQVIHADKDFMESYKKAKEEIKNREFVD